MFVARLSRVRGNREETVHGYEIWSLLEPNAVFDITGHLADKLSLIQNYPSQLRLVNELYDASGELCHATSPLPNLASSDVLRAL